jgi:hypothetical protein
MHGMSTNLFWRPIPDDEPLPYVLKQLLGRKIWDDGGLHGEWTEIGRELLPWLEGVRDAGGEVGTEAQQLIALINVHGTIEVAIK